MGDFNRKKEIFENKVKKGYSDGLTYNDFKSIEKLIRQVEKMDQRNPEVGILLGKMRRVHEIMKQNGGAHKFSNVNRDYILSHALLLPLAVSDSERVNIAIMKNQVIAECKLKNGKIITIREASNDYVEGRVNHEHIEELYPDKPLNVANYVSGKFKIKMNDSLELLCKIYKFKLAENTRFGGNKELDAHANHYRDAFAAVDSDTDAYQLDEIYEYEQELLSRAGFTDVDGKSIEELYAQRMAIIERLRKGEYDPDFQFVEPERVFLYRK